MLVGTTALGASDLQNRLLACRRALLAGEKLQGKLVLNKQLETKPRSSCAIEIKSPADN